MLRLPIDVDVPRVVEAFQKTLNVILMAPPGIGKTLRVPAALARLLIDQKSSKKIVALVPTRIAAVSAANRIAEENSWSLGNEVGYQVRFDHRSSKDTKLIFMTEGVFVKRMSHHSFLSEIDTVIFDEFHERSSLNDIAFGYCFEQQMLADGGDRIKILVMSATLEKQKLENYLSDPLTINVEIKPFTLQIIKSKKVQRLQFDAILLDQMVEVVKEAYRHQKKDLLVFLPGLHEIRQLQQRLGGSAGGVTIEILHGSIPLDEQRRILAPAAHRRFILATNVAESSLTLPSVDCVIDSGLEKRAVYERKIGFQRLELKRISLFSARQRAGRAARVGPGACYQLWHDSDERSMAEQIEPEILKSSLLEETLILASVGVTDPQHFSWLDKPTQNFTPILQKLKNWNLLGADNKMTPLGRDVQRCPLDLERGLLFIELCVRGFQAQAASFLAFLETTQFSTFNQDFHLDEIPLNDLGQKVESQLLKIHMDVAAMKPSDTFRITLIQVFLKFFPEKMAQRKDLTNGISSLGRGVQFSPHLVSKESDYFLLLNGRDISDTTTAIDFAISFSKEEFEKLSQIEQRIETGYVIDFEKRMIYKQQKKLSGLFTLTVGTKLPLDEKKDREIFKTVLRNHILEFIQNHPAAPSYYKKINFLRKKAGPLGYADQDFLFLESFPEKLIEALESTETSLAEFFDYDVYGFFVFLTPQPVKADFQKLPNTYALVSGKTVPIDYESELAPLISVRLQELLGVLKTPRILDQRLTLTVELLAPNYRPTQITADLGNFWKNSYQDVRKDLRARYPRHDWPENPLEWKPEMSKRFKKSNV